MGFSLMTNPPGPRAADKLSRIPAIDEHGDVLGIAPYDEVAPGLYPDEAAYTLDSGEDVAVSVFKERLENNNGVSFTVWVRLIEPDGSTKLDPSGRDVEISFTHTADAQMLEQHSVDAIAREMLLAGLGEPPALTQSVTIDPLPENAAPGMTLLGEPGTTVELPVVLIDPASRLNASIRSAVSYLNEAGEGDPASLLTGSE